MTDLALYLDDVERFLRRYVAFPSDHEPVAVALWVAHAWVVERFDVSPILAVTSAEMRSGKTRVLDCVELLVPEPRRMVMPSEAVFYTVASREPRPTILLDEVDALFGPRPSERTEGIRAVLNSGNRAGTPVLRVSMEGKRRTVEELDVFGAKCVAGIGDLPSTVADRSILVRMRRRASDEPVARFRLRTAKAEAEDIELPDWHAVTLVTDVTDVPEGISDRAADGWEPLLALADGAGGTWPARARASAVALSPEGPAVNSIGVQLLTDVRDVFGEDAYVTTKDLLERLHALDSGTWADWYGSPISAKKLAELLRPYGAKPTLRRPATGTEPVRAYWRQDLMDPWRRYVASPATDTSDTPVTDDVDLELAERATDADAEGLWAA